jgi:hypothetical protein
VLDVNIKEGLFGKGTTGRGKRKKRGRRAEYDRNHYMLA